MAPAEKPAPYVLGIDGGGSRCTAVVARVDRGFDTAPVILGRGHGGPANPRVTGHDPACTAISTAIMAAFESAGMQPGSVETACLGLAGVGLPADRDAVRAWAERVGVARRVIVVPDGLVLFADGGAEPWGIVLIAGTGSLALARPASAPLTAAAPYERCGGWGPLLGDEGSGYAIGLAALKAAMRFADGRGPDTSLLAAVLRRFMANGPADLVASIQSPLVGRREIAEVARDALAAAEAGDPVATRIVAGAAGDLAAHVQALAHRNSFASDGYPLRLAGGLLAGSAVFRRLVVEALATDGAPGSVGVVTDPAAAAARFAMLA